MKDYYAILGVDRGATPEEVKKAFRRLARATHPDANPGDTAAEERFREVAEAYEVLSNPDKRAAYDRGESPDLSDLFAGFGGLDDMLRAFFGSSGMGGFGFRAGRAGRQPGPDVLVRSTVTLADAGFGTTVPLAFHAPRTCPACSGSGSAPGTSPIRCDRCGGSGSMQVGRRTMLGTITTIGTCDRCGGRGELIHTPCPNCRARRVVDGDVEVSVEIPQGVEDGTRLRLRGRGGASADGGDPGDLYVEVRVAPDQRFSREGDDLRHLARVGVTEAALGTSVAVPLLDGDDVDVDIPRGTQPGTVLRLSGRGMGRLHRRGRGDLLVEVRVEVPTDLSPDEERLLRELAALRDEQPARQRRLRRSR